MVKIIGFISCFVFYIYIFVLLIGYLLTKAPIQLALNCGDQHTIQTVVQYTPTPFKQINSGGGGGNSLPPPSQPRGQQNTIKYTEDTFYLTPSTTIRAPQPLYIRYTPEQELYQSYRTHSMSLHYDLPLPEDGTHTLILKFAETQFVHAKQRTFTVRVAGFPVVRDLDLIDLLQAPFSAFHLYVEVEHTPQGKVRVMRYAYPKAVAATPSSSSQSSKGAEGGARKSRFPDEVLDSIIFDEDQKFFMPPPATQQQQQQQQSQQSQSQQSAKQGTGTQKYMIHLVDESVEWQVPQEEKGGARAGNKILQLSLEKGVGHPFVNGIVLQRGSIEQSDFKNYFQAIRAWSAHPEEAQRLHRQTEKIRVQRRWLSTSSRQTQYASDSYAKGNDLQPTINYELKWESVPPSSITDIFINIKAFVIFVIMLVEILCFTQLDSVSSRIPTEVVQDRRNKRDNRSQAAQILNSQQAQHQALNAHLQGQTHQSKKKKSGSNKRAQSGPVSQRQQQ